MGTLLPIHMTGVLGAVDIIAKSAIEESFTTTEERTIVKGKITLRKVYNKGFCLNILEKQPEIVKYASAYSSVLLTIYYMLVLIFKRGKLKSAGLSLMTAGAWSNTFDRWVRGYVVDYIAFPSKKEKLSKITLNLADVFLAAGSVIYTVGTFFYKKKNKTDA